MALPLSVDHARKSTELLTINIHLRRCDAIDFVKWLDRHRILTDNNPQEDVLCMIREQIDRELIKGTK